MIPCFFFAKEYYILYNIDTENWMQSVRWSPSYIGIYATSFEWLRHIPETKTEIVAGREEDGAHV